MADSRKPRRTPIDPKLKPSTEPPEPLRAMISVTLDTRERYNQTLMLYGAATKQRVNADQFLTWLLDQMEPEIRILMREALDNEVDKEKN